MKAVVRRGTRLVVDQVPDPVPVFGTVQARTLACGICGSDLHALQHLDRMVESARRTRSPFAVDPSRDLVMGHESAAEILDYAEGSFRPLPVGTRVCAMPVTLSAAGLATVGYSNAFPGGFGERMLLQEQLLLPIPNGLPSHLAALTEPLAVALHAVNAAELAPDDVPLVIAAPSVLPSSLRSGLPAPRRSWPRTSRRPVARWRSRWAPTSWSTRPSCHRGNSGRTWPIPTASIPTTR